MVIKSVNQCFDKTKTHVKDFWDVSIRGLHIGPGELGPEGFYLQKNIVKYKIWNNIVIYNSRNMTIKSSLSWLTCMRTVRMSTAELECLTRSSTGERSSSSTALRYDESQDRLLHHHHHHHHLHHLHHQYLYDPLHGLVQCDVQPSCHSLVKPNMRLLHLKKNAPWQKYLIEWKEDTDSILWMDDTETQRPEMILLGRKQVGKIEIFRKLSVWQLCGWSFVILLQSFVKYASNSDLSHGPLIG